MTNAVPRLTKPHCYVVYALAPEGMPASQANEVFNAFIGDRRLPLPVFHDHFIGRPGGVAVFYVATAAEREALSASRRLEGWQVDIHPLVFSRSPAGFDEQTAFTLRAYRGRDWEELQRELEPPAGEPGQQGRTASEDDTEAEM